MISWSSRPIEERNLFNPAFCSLVLAAAIREFQKEAKTAMPYSLTLLVLPLCLHQATRNEILDHKRISVLRVLAHRPDLLVDFVPRTQALLQNTMEAFALLASKGCIKITEDGGIELLPRKVSSQELGTEDAEMCRSAAALLGRNFAQINDRITVYTSLSIRP